MAASSKKRQSVASIKIRTKVPCFRIYPGRNSTKTLADLKTVEIVLSREQAIHLASHLLLGAKEEWGQIEITAYRFKGYLTVTALVQDKESEA
jgi:hypothetical protein